MGNRAATGLTNQSRPASVWRKHSCDRQRRRNMMRGSGGLVGVVIAGLLIAGMGCTDTRYLMPTPNIYIGGKLKPFDDVPPALQSNHVEVLYLTDRALEEGSSPESPEYGHKRSRSVAFGVCDVRFGKDVSWDDRCGEGQHVGQALGEARRCRDQDNRTLPFSADAEDAGRNSAIGDRADDGRDDASDYHQRRDGRGLRNLSAGAAGAAGEEPGEGRVCLCPRRAE